MIVDRRLYQGHEADLAIDVGYVEHVATHPDAQRLGHASAVMRRVGDIVAEEYALGGLATGSNAFYERLGWETWRGEIWLAGQGGRRRMPEQEGDVMVLRTPTTPSTLDVAAPLLGWAREADPW
jgi:aminoglycoside 2'-N-acetyltransferase I